MQKSQKGFTLIELVVVIVLLGILGVTALARFQNLSVQAAAAANSGVASEISAGASINYAAAVTGLVGFTPVTLAPLSTCANIGGILASGVFPTTHTYVTGGACTAIAGSTFTCTVTQTANPAAAAAVATVLCTGG